MEMILSGHPLYGAGCLAPGTGELVSRLSPQAKASRSPRVPLIPAGKGVQGNGCCWRQAPLNSAEDSAWSVQLRGRAACPVAHHPREWPEGDGNMNTKRPTRLGGAATGSTVEAEDRLCHGVGHTMEVEGGPYLGAGPKADAEDRPCHPTGHTAEAEVGPYHGAGPTAEAEGGPCRGVGPTAEAELKLYCGAGDRQGGSSENHEIYACKDGEFNELTEPPKHQRRDQCVQAGEGSATIVTGLSETHPRPTWEPTRTSTTAGLLPAGLVTMATGAVGGRAQLCDAAQAGVKVGASDCDEHKEAEEHDDEFGTFEKAGNLVRWAEYSGPLRLQCEDLHDQSGTTAGWSLEPGREVAARRMCSSNRAAERWESTCPSISVTPSCDGDGWRAFQGDDGQTQESHFGTFPLSKWEMAQWGVEGKWWPNDALEHHTFEPTSPSESSLGKAGLESMFHSCFPTVSSASSSDPIPPLGQLLGRSEEKWGEGFLSTQACDLWGLLWNVDETVGLKYKWAECRSRRQLLASLRLDPASTDTTSGRTRTLGWSPLFSRETMEFQSFPVTLDQDYKELMLIKDSVPQLQTNGFSPTHRIQAFFYHWSQADRNGKTKTPYSFNKNFTA